ncbi:hypothetical protein CHU98_g4161 [Xylaria longipes]|nr:hypothetical protein CHU98_g4161 [Xylaria longipes]
MPSQLVGANHRDRCKRGSAQAKKSSKIPTSAVFNRLILHYSRSEWASGQSWGSHFQEVGTESYLSYLTYPTYLSTYLTYLSTYLNAVGTMGKRAKAIIGGWSVSISYVYRVGAFLWPNMTLGVLTPPQLRALLDILIHHETYVEVQSFQYPEAIETYGWPFVDRDEKGRPAKPHGLSSSPLLQLLLSRLALGAPAVRDLSTEFWSVKFKGIMRQFGDADLSDSYEKGTLGTRKRLATAASVIHEAITRGLLAGVDGPYHALPDLHYAYDIEKAEDLARAWHDCICHLVYGNLIDEIFDQLTHTEDLEAHSPALKAAVEYAEFYIATFLHRVFILSAEGPYLLKLIENIHKLIPYTVMGQTLRVGNAASMINATSETSLITPKMTITDSECSSEQIVSVQSQHGSNIELDRPDFERFRWNEPYLTRPRILSLVLEWDASDFRKAAEKIKLDEEGISNKRITAIDRHMAADRRQRESSRKKSIQEQKSIVVAIFEAEDEQLLESLTDRQHTSCLEYYAAKVAIRDREHIIDVLCNSTPDLTTAIVLEGLGALDPMIRVVHKNVDLRKHLNALEGFLGDFIKTTKPKTQDKNSGLGSPAVKDFVELLQRNRHLLWVYLHDFCSGCPDLRDTWRGWTLANFLGLDSTIKVFQWKSKDDSHERNTHIHGKLQTTNTGDIGSNLQDAFDKLADSQRIIVLERIEAHSRYLTTLSEQSRSKMQKVIDDLHRRSYKDAENTSGPGTYALRWQALLDETLITPSVPKGPPRLGKDVSGLRAVRKPDNQANADSLDANAAILARHKSTTLISPDVAVVVKALGPQFKMMVANISRDGLPEV